MTYKLAIISDTHFSKEHKLTEAMKNLLATCSLIVHAGDIGEKAEFQELQKIAPVIAVMGNNKYDRNTYALPESQKKNFHGLNINVTHGTTRTWTDYLEAGVSKFFRNKILQSEMVVSRLKRSSTKSKLVIFGHTHLPYFRTISDVVYLNPGAAYQYKTRVGSIVIAVIKDKKLAGLTLHYLIP